MARPARPAQTRRSLGLEALRGHRARLALGALWVLKAPTRLSLGHRGHKEQRGRLEA